MKKFWLVLSVFLVIALAAVGTASLFGGSKIRTLFGASEDALAGGDNQESALLKTGQRELKDATSDAGVQH